MAGVSHTTVSLYLSKRGNACSAETGRRIDAAIEALNYTPSRPSRALRGERMHVFGVAFVSPRGQELFGLNVFSERVWIGMISAAAALGLRLLIYPESERIGPNAHAFLDGQIDGLILCEDSHNDRLARIAAAGMPVVALSRSRELPDGIGAAFADEDDTMRLAVSHLQELGHRRIAHYCGPTAGIPFDPYDGPSDIARSRRDAFLVMAPECADLVSAPNRWIGSDAEPFVAACLGGRDPATAVVCANDRLAACVIRAAVRLGLSVPGDLSVVGVDCDHALHRQLPEAKGLTSIDIPCEAIGARAVTLLDAIIRGETRGELSYRIPVTELVVGETTGPAR